MIPLASKLTWLAAVLKYGANVYVRLVKTDPTEDDEDIEIGDLTEADFMGYTATGNPFSAATPAIDTEDRGKIISALCSFEASGISGSQTIYGIYITADVNASLALLWWHRFDTPIVINSDGDKIERIIDFYDDELTIA